MSLRKTLRNPIALALQGFAGGALLVLAVHPYAGHDASAPQPEAGSVLETMRA